MEAQTQMDPGTLFSEAVKYQSTGRFSEAAQCYQQLLQQNPSHAGALQNYATLYLQAGRVEEGVRYFEHIVKTQPRLAEGYNALGLLLMQQNKIEEAIRWFNNAVSLKPRYAFCYINLANAYFLLGDMEQAEAMAVRAMEINPDVHAPAYIATACRKIKDPKDALAIRIMERSKKKSIPDNQRVFLDFALGKLYDDFGECDKAFKHYDRANQLHAKSAPFDVEGYKQSIDTIIQVFDAEKCREKAEAVTEPELPVFIVGMPRSGTSLVERILDNHPQIHGAGELATLKHLAHREFPVLSQSGQKFPQCMNDATPEILGELSQRYIDTLRAIKASSNIRRITNKMPFNYNYLGLIAMMFPQAKIIHCIRHPLDVYLSNYFQLYLSGNTFCYAKERLIPFYQHYVRMMRHWKEVLPIEILDVRYEDLVSDKEPQIRRMLEYLNVPWDEQCLSPEKNKRAARTASSWQVQQPIHKGATARWKRYKKHLKEVQESLQPCIEELGY